MCGGGRGLSGLPAGQPRRQSIAPSNLASSLKLVKVRAPTWATLATTPLLSSHLMSSTPVWAGHSSSPLDVAPLLGAGTAAAAAVALLPSAASAVAAAGLCHRSLAGGVGFTGAAAVAGLAAGAVAATRSGARRRAAACPACGRGSCGRLRASRCVAAGLLEGCVSRMAVLLQEAAMFRDVRSPADCYKAVGCATSLCAKGSAGGRHVTQVARMWGGNWARG